jgi:hypothetical protein
VSDPGENFTTETTEDTEKKEGGGTREIKIQKIIFEEIFIIY